MNTQLENNTINRLNTAKPSKYQVILFNDDTTPMEFVIELLKNIFGHNQQSAEDITVSIHNEGKGTAGVYYYEIAEQKVSESTILSRTAGFPLSLDIEEV
jgi:ATP-dependent Clp protease adaptor protein ClpS